MDEIKYTLKPIHQNLEKIEDLVMPEVKDRVIEKRGDVQEFTMADIEYNLKQTNNTKKELEAKKLHENAIAENIEHFHKFVKKMSDEDITTVWMYKQAKGWVKTCEDKLAQIDAQLESDNKEIEEIKKQLPLLADVVSPYAEENK